MDKENPLKMSSIEWTKCRLDDALTILNQMKDSMKQRNEKLVFSSLVGTLIAALDVTVHMSMSMSKPEATETMIKSMEHTFLEAFEDWRKELDQIKLRQDAEKLR